MTFWEKVKHIDITNLGDGWGIFFALVVIGGFIVWAGINNKGALGGPHGLDW